MVSSEFCRGHVLRIAVGITIAVLLLTGNATSKTLTVDISGRANYTRIQDAINNSSSGDTILVNSGVYYEKVNVNKQLILKGIDTGGGMPVVSTNSSGSAIALNADLSTLQGFTAINTNISWPSAGIQVNSSYNIIKNNNVSNSYHGIYILYSPPTPYHNINSFGGNTLSNNIVSNNIYGIYLYGSRENNLSGNIALNNIYGISLRYSLNNNLNDNAASRNGYGILLSYSYGNTLINNTMSGNNYNFGVYGLSIFFNNQINTSNIVDGKPIYYIKDAVDTVYESSSNAGTLYCINCVNVTIKDMNLSKNVIGVYFWNTTYSRVQNINASDNYEGIFLEASSNNTLGGNSALSNANNGISLGSSRDNILNSNIVTNNPVGIYLISYPTFIDLLPLPFETSPLGVGVTMPPTINNTIYNNIFNNTNNSRVFASSNKWNITKTSGENIIEGLYLGGNIWTNPNGTGFSQTCFDADNDEICDSPYTLDSNNIDYLPLAYKPSPIPTTPIPTTPTATATPTPMPVIGSISGFKINDIDGNGIQNDGEAGLSGWKIKLRGIGRETRHIKRETFTDNSGFYKFDNLPAGRYLVIEKLKNGFVPISSPVRAIMLAQAENSMNNNFTNRPIFRPISMPTPTPIITPEPSWPIPADKYVFVERWINIGAGAYLDFPTYIFDKGNDTLKPFIVPPGRWFPLENLTELKIVYGRGTESYGINSQVFAIIELPFTEPPKYDTDVVVTIEKVDNQGAVYLRRGDEQIVLKPGENWITQGKGNIPNSTSEERISNYGIYEKSKIQLYKE